MDVESLAFVYYFIGSFILLKSISRFQNKMYRCWDMQFYADTHFVIGYFVNPGVFMLACRMKGKNSGLVVYHEPQRTLTC